MKTDKAIKHFGSQRELAAVLGLHEANITRWKKTGIIPLKHIWTLREKSNYKLALRLSDYRRPVE